MSSRSSHRPAVAAFLTLAALAAFHPPAFAQAAGAPAPRPARGSALAADAEGSEQRMSLMGFVLSSASAAGAVAACEAPSAIAIRNCIERIIPDWTRLTGQPGVEPMYLDAIPLMWTDAYERAKAIQSAAPPIPCDKVLSTARSMTIWRYCPAPWR